MIFVIPVILDLDAATFNDTLLTDSRYKKVRTLMTLTSDIKSKEASLGPLVYKLKWIEWEPKFENYLSNIMGFDGVTL